MLVLPVYRAETNVWQGLAAPLLHVLIFTTFTKKQDCVSLFFIGGLYDAFTTCTEVGVTCSIYTVSEYT